MPIKIEKAERIKSKLRLGIAGPAGSGKTMGSLLLARGLVGPGGRILLIDTENGSGNLYAHLMAYDIIKLKDNYAPKNYIEAIEAAEEGNYDVVIIDSLSHAWVGTGGLLDQVDKKQGNSFTAWRDITPQHNQLVEALLTSPLHVIATMRSKTEYGTDTDKNGKMTVKKMGLAPVQREGMDYEFTVMFDVNQEHYACASKDRTSMFANEVFQINDEVGKRLLEWLNSGRDDQKDILMKKKLKVVQLCEMMGVDRKSPEAIKGLVLGITKLELVDANFDEIISRLEITVKERREALQNAPDKSTGDMKESEAPKVETPVATTV